MSTRDLRLQPIKGNPGFRSAVAEFRLIGCKISRSLKIGGKIKGLRAKKEKTSDKVSREKINKPEFRLDFNSSSLLQCQ
jgi:hypothetical protein